MTQFTMKDIDRYLRSIEYKVGRKFILSVKGTNPEGYFELLSYRPPDKYNPTRIGTAVGIDNLLQLVMACHTLASEIAYYNDLDKGLE